MATASAQEVSASLTGSVTDPSGAAIAGASVSIAETTRGLTYPTTTNEAGVYFYPRIPPGIYNLRVESQGFKASLREGLSLEVNQRARFNVVMEVGAVNESVEVTGEPPLLQTDTTIVGNTITSNKIENLPLLSRNYISTLLLTPGVTTTNPADFNNDRRTAGGGRPYVNGNRKEANNFLLDGIDNNQVSDNLTAYQPNPDSISEVKMITNNASAEFGNFQGGVVNVVLKGGTNELHGSVFHFFKNDKLNANAWARNWNVNPTTGRSLARVPVRYNSFGFTAGGPVFIPKFFDGRNKLFFFVDYMGLRRPFPAAVSTPTVMPIAFRNGDFSRLLNLQQELGRANVQLYNPFNLLPDGTRAPFANNQIPGGMISPAAKALLSDTANYPAPLSNDLRFNQLNVATSKLTLDQGDVRVDAKPNERNDLSIRYSHSAQSNPGTNSFPLLFGTFNESPFKAGVVNWTHTFTPTLVNEARVGVNRITLFNGGTDKGFEDLNAKYGIAGVNSPGLLSIQFSNSLLSNIGNSNIGTQQLFANTTYQFVDNLTIIRGKHMMKMGGQLLRQQMNTFYSGNNGRTGFLAFSGRFTGRTSSQFAWSDADFLLGLPETLGRGLQSGTWGHRKWITGLYFQDDWRIHRSLTLNLGMRWEYHTPLVEVKDRQANFEMFSGKILLAGKDGNIAERFMNPSRRIFSQELGLPGPPGIIWWFAAPTPSQALWRERERICVCR
ncbi:MAG: carboxypeptidase regulatory-like domain-containing protein [Bryobacterales bacterium]|nr:carboxypeptidase regulatory-like domain-containing protein [Bryobacterales bacterium]